MKVIPVILSGGSGTRLWPLSRDLYPKQFLKLTDTNESLLQHTLKRLKKFHFENPLIICNEMHRFIVTQQLKEIDQPGICVLEPLGKNTAPAIAIAAFYAKFQLDDAILLVLPADHLLEEGEIFSDGLVQATEYAKQGQLVTFGIQPTRPDIGYGYIQAGDLYQGSNSFKVKRFVEKPDLETAQRYLQEGNYYWNSGMFCFKASAFLDDLRFFAPDIYETCEKTFNLSQNSADNNFVINKDLFAHCRSDSIDYAVMEKTDKAVVIPLRCAWSDIGAWASLWEARKQHEADNVILGDVLTQEVEGSYLHAESRLMVAIGLKDIVAVETADAVFIADKSKASLIKDTVQMLKNNGREEASVHRRVHRPWGMYDILIEGVHFKVKHITVNPKSMLSLQLHHHRSEHWVVVSGIAEVTRGEEILTLYQNQSTYIPAETQHRLYNPGDDILEIIEVQSGSYLGEDDIVRFDDQYGRR